MKKLFLWALAAVLMMVVIFLQPGCSVQSSGWKTNWQNGEYVVDELSVKSMRRYFEDTGYEMFPLAKIPPGVIKETENWCKVKHGPNSGYIGTLSYPMLLPPKSLCMNPNPLSVETIKSLCGFLGMKMKWADTKNRKFACEEHNPKGNTPLSRLGEMALRVKNVQTD